MSLLAAVFVAGHLAWSSGHAATLGHSRLVSAAGEPLRVTISVSQLSASQAETLRVVPAPASEWTNAGLTPPVDMATLQARLIDGYTPGTRVIQVWSDQVFNQPIVDLLLDIHTSSGVQRYQVSLLAQGEVAPVSAPEVASPAPARAAEAVVSPSETFTERKPVLIRPGDTMFAVAQRHAVSGVSVYQMMIALQRANSQAFIHGNLNLVRAGEELSMPDMAALTAISDREARRLFHEQVIAFNLLQQGQGSGMANIAMGTQVLDSDDARPTDNGGITNVPESRAAPGDQLKLSGSGATVLSAQQSTGAEGATSPVSADSTASGAAAAGSDASAASGSSTANVMDGVAKTAHAATTPGSPAGDSSSGDGRAGSPGSTSVSAESTVQGSDGGQADDAVATRMAIDDAQARVSQLEENVKNLNRALQSQGEAAKDIVMDGAIGLRQSLTDVATAVTEATIGDEEFINGSADSAQGDRAAPSSADESGTQQDKVTSTMASVTTWLSANIIGVITALLALLVLVIAWVLRRANISQSSTESAVTPEMVKEKLDQINLDLSEPTINDSRSSR